MDAVPEVEFDVLGRAEPQQAVELGRCGQQPGLEDAARHAVDAVPCPDELGARVVRAAEELGHHLEAAHRLDQGRPV
ncbi:hypothetical protein LOK46_14460 [Methylobacterium sp. NMS14P]|uniref:hypothetical protein n=1 Tax=Methylobacterium sp. NMS14P TaxID=2894310 RepID=UPI00235974CA|nr:hypothetical protein [Methylobacterium sp. NMS14P]WCS27975.1 hypothetical protein LOK46_14460 [Methylobacterium sp. NMS14P]